MSASRPAIRGLLSQVLASPAKHAARATSTANGLPASAAAAAAAVAGGPSPCRTFHSSPPVAARRRSRFKSVKAEELGLVTPQDMDRFTREKFPEYSADERAQLSKAYTHEQLKAIEAGEQAVDPRDLARQGRLRTDQYRLPYVDDLSRTRPVLDKRVRKHPPPANMNAKFMEPDEFSEDFLDWISGFLPKNVELSELNEQQLRELAEKHAPSPLDVTRYFEERSVLTDGNVPQHTALAPALPDKVPGVTGMYERAAETDNSRIDPHGDLTPVSKKTGMSLEEISDFTVRILMTKFVSNQTRLGKVASLYVLAVAGDRNGRLGIGEAKSVEGSSASRKAKQMAIASMRPIPRYENRTIYGNITTKISGTVVDLRSRPPGFGLRVPFLLFEMCRAAGIQDISAHIPRSRNKMNVVKAAYKALVNQPNPEEIAIGRGKKLVDVRKVYYGGAVY